MFSKITLLAAVSTGLACLAGVSAMPVSGSSLQARAGPSGSVVSPPGNTNVLNLGGAGALHIQYQRVNETLPNQQGPAYTIGIDLVLEDPAHQQADMPITYGFRANPMTADLIDGYFVPPQGACGTYNLVVTEHQYYLGEVVSFTAAAPSVSITCGPIQ